MRVYKISEAKNVCRLKGHKMSVDELSVDEMPADKM